MRKYLAKINIRNYYMSSQTPAASMPPVFPGYFPSYGSGFQQYNDEAILGAINSNARQLTGDINGISKDVTQSSLGLRDAIERGNSINNTAIERTAAVSQSAIERVAAENRASALIADAASRQYASDNFRDVIRNTDANGYSATSATERTAAVTQSAIERTAGENRASNLISDSASRQFAADQFRDVIRTVDANGYTATGATERTAAVTQSAIERTAGENRASNLVADAASRQFAADQFRDVIRTVDSNGYTATSATERTASQLALSVERNGAANTHATERNATQILGSVERTAGETRLTNVIADAASRQAAADTARDVLRAVDSNGFTGTSTTERTNAQLSLAIERNGATNAHTTERNASQILSNLERTSGEARLTTTVTDAATRQAAAEQAQQIHSAIDRNGGAAVNATQTSYAGLLGSIERNAGESRMAAVQLDSTNQARMADTRRDIIGQVNQTTNAILTSVDKNGADTRSMVAETAWESRTGLNTGFANTMLNQEKLYAATQLQAGQNYASMLLEQQKAKDYLAGRGDNQFAANQMEMQKAKAELGHQMGDHYSSLLLEQNKTREYLGSKSDNQFAMNQLELQKVKADLATQAAQQFSIGQLEQQKLGSLISAQLAESKYEGLKSQQFLADKIDHTSESIKLRVDNIDRDRLRDHLTSEKNENSVLKILELTELSRRRDYDRGPYYGDRGGDHGHHHGGPR
jgi:biopolymer transport protein ExbD